MDLAVAQPRISRAIRRSRRARAAFARRRRRSAVLAVCISLGLAGVAVLGVGAATGEDVVQAAVGRAQDLAELLDGRSPGERTQAQLNKTKHARAAAAKLRLVPHSPLS